MSTARGIARERLRRLGSAARASAELAGADREARDGAIEEADLAGLSVREISQDVGVSPTRVQAVILARAATRQARQREALQLE